MTVPEWVPPAISVAAVLTSWWAAVRARAAQREIADRYIPGWRVDRIGNALLFQNASPETAFDVDVEMAPHWVSGGSGHHDVVTPHSAFMVYSDTDAEAFPDESIRITWHRERARKGAPKLEWTYPMRWLYERDVS